MFAILNNPSLTPQDRERVISLITRDIEKDLILKTQEIVREELKLSGNTDNVVKQERQNPSEKWRHDPQAVCDFLKKFSTDSILKYAFHSWDSNDFKGYDDFLNKISARLSKEGVYKNLYYHNIGLNYTLRNFIENNGQKKEFSIPKEKIQIGLRYPDGIIRNWMKNNPQMRLGEMPMSAFPLEYRPSEMNDGHVIANMEDLIEYFKHIIEFRDIDFEAMIFDTFGDIQVGNSDFIPVIDDSVKGISFYTYTNVVKSFLITVLDNIKGRVQGGAPPTVRIFVSNKTNSSFELHILHEGSFAQKDINDSKLRYTGTLASWRVWQNGTYDSLVSVCDYSVISKFLSDDEARSLNTYRIDYLYPGISCDADDTDSPESKVTLLKDEAPGFEYIMKFYK